MTHLWVRAEQRNSEERVGLTPEGARKLIEKGFRITIEDSPTRVIKTADYLTAGCEPAPFGHWPQAPEEAFIFGLKELPEETSPLSHRHIMFGHAYKGQAPGLRLLARLKAGGGALLDIEALTDEDGRRLAAFGYYAGYAGAAVSVEAWAAQQQGLICPPLTQSTTRAAWLGRLRSRLAGRAPPRVIIIGAKGRVGQGARDLCAELGCDLTLWDLAETARGAPFPEILAHDIFLNCILARPGAPQFLTPDCLDQPRQLTVVGDIACDPGTSYAPIQIYDQVSSWGQPVWRVAQNPLLDVMAIDNLPSLLPAESSHDFARQLLPLLTQLSDLRHGAWARALAQYQHHSANL